MDAADIVRRRIKIYVEKQAKRSPFEPPDRNGHETIQHTIEALEHLLCDLEDAEVTPRH